MILWRSPVLFRSSCSVHAASVHAVLGMICQRDQSFDHHQVSGIRNSVFMREMFLLMRAGFECLREDVPDVLQLFSEVLIQPVLPQEKLALAKSQVVTPHLGYISNPIPVVLRSCV